MVVWADGSNSQIRGPFEGCLILLNVIENDLVGHGDMPDEYVMKIMSAVADASANGMCVLCGYDRATLAPVPDSLGGANDVNVPWLIKDLPDEFPLMPDDRMHEFAKLGRKALSLSFIKFIGHKVKMGGWCNISGRKVLLPIIDVTV